MMYSTQPRRLPICALVLVVVGLVPRTTQAIDCTKAKTPTEKAICASVELKTLDDRLNAVYGRMIAKYEGAGAEEIRTNQIRWLQNRDFCADRVECLKEQIPWRTSDLEQAETEVDTLRNGKDTAKRVEAVERLIQRNAEAAIYSGHLGARFALDELKTHLGEGEPADVRYRVAAALASIDPENAPPDVVPLLERALADVYLPNRLSAADGLRALGPKGLPAWRNLLKVARDEEDLDIRRRARSALATVGPDKPETVRELVAGLEEGNSCAQAATGLAVLGPRAKKAVGTLMRVLMEDSCGFEARTALVAIGEASVPALVRALRSKNLYLRKEGLQILWELGPKAESATDALIHSMNADRSTSVRELAYYALSHIGTPQARAATAAGKPRTPESKPDYTTLYTEDEIGRELPPTPDLVYPAELASWQTSTTKGGTTYAVSLHQGKDRPDRLVVWVRQGDKFRRLLEKSSSNPDGGELSFQTPEFFEVGDGSFLHVQLLVAGTGYFHEDEVYGLGDEACLEPVEYVAPAKAYAPQLAAGEGVAKGEMLEFHDNDMGFRFWIWKDGDANCCPSAGEVTGDFALTQVAPSTKPECGRSWKLAPATFRRADGSTR
ncbi:MAG TPA: lysozyme inhibitor LprI family protein [Polyangiales bacterium]|nr:lysozyme inhibitor LprI family protein [Polyangiales bacterium]